MISKRLSFILTFTLRCVIIITTSFLDTFCNFYPLLINIFVDNVKYTDVDYIVFTDASRYVLKGKSPYERLTYRYTPILSYFLVFNLLFNMNFGKILFSVLDMVLAHFTMKLNGQKLRSVIIFILLNPILLNVSTRGNADVIVVVLVVVSLYYLKQGKYVWSALFYSLSIHTKIYPVIYTPTIALYVFHKCKYNWRSKKLWKTMWIFVVVVAGVNLLLIGLFYVLYGYTFLYESYLYHLVRSDNRHNFSVYFYMIYLNSVGKNSAMSLLMFVPQFFLLLYFSFKYHKKIDLAIILQTITFVCYNKVCTVQYFVWYLPLFALVYDRIEKTKRKYFFLLLGVWFVAQVLWLQQGFNLEFLGENSYLHIWMASLFFFGVNIMIMLFLAKNCN